MKPRSGERRRLGRRTSDWLFPTLLWLIALASLLTARHYRQRANDLETMNASLVQQRQLLERKVQLLERAPKLPTPKPTAAKNKQP